MTDTRAVVATSAPVGQTNAFASDLPRPAPGPADAQSRIAALTPGQRAAAVKQAELVAVVGRRLAARPYSERRAILAHMAPHLGARGVPPATVTAFDPTDANLASAVGHAVIIGSLLDPGSDQPDGDPATSAPAR